MELKNEAADPSNYLKVSRKSIDSYGDEAVATWHTHPRNNVNLSALDYLMFQTLPKLRHYIVTETRIRSFYVANKKVMLDEADCV